MRGISWLAANQLACQEGLCTMEWVSVCRCPRASCNPSAFAVLSIVLCRKYKKKTKVCEIQQSLFYSHLYKNIIKLQFVLLTVPRNVHNTIQKHISRCLASSLISLGAGNFNVSKWQHSMCREVLLLWKSVPLSSLLSSSHSVRISNFVQ